MCGIERFGKTHPLEIKKAAKKARKNTLTDTFRSRFHIKCSSEKYEQHRRDTSNGRASRILEQPLDAIKANRHRDTQTFGLILKEK